MKIDPKKILKQNPFVLAPMDDVTDIAFRELCEEKGASYSTTELTNVESVIRDKVYKSRYERGNLKINSIQLFGSKPETFANAALKVYDEADMIDVNFGCPSPTVTRNDAGSSLLKDPKNVGKIIETLVNSVDKPITAKIRLGYTKTTYNEVAKEIEDAGANVIAVHGRTATQKYSGKANWDAIKEIYEKTNIPIIGNGDIKTEEDIDKYMKEDPHCDALMIGRAAIGNPLLFERFNYYRNKGERLQIDNFKEKQKELFQLYLKKLDGKEFHNINIKIQRQAMWFMKGIEGVKELRSEISKTKDIDEIMELIKKF